MIEKVTALTIQAQNTDALEAMKSEIMSIMFSVIGFLIVSLISLIVYIWKSDKSEKSLLRKAVSEMAEGVTLLRIMVGKHDTKFEENDKWKERAEEHIFPVKYSK